MESRIGTRAPNRITRKAPDLSVAGYRATQRPSTRMHSVQRADQSTRNPIRIVLIEDSRLACDQFAALLDGQPDFEVVATAATISSGLARVRETKPHVVLVDASLSNYDCYRCLTSAKHLAPEARLILMNVRSVHQDIIAFVRAGANGFILKDATVEDFVGTVRSVARGTDVVPAILTSTLVSYIAGLSIARAPSSVPQAAVRITNREREIAALIAEGLTNKEIRPASQRRDAHGQDPRTQHPGKARLAYAPPDCRPRTEG
jgi:DNA-binding NarL/FixJ family response regulator